MKRAVDRDFSDTTPAYSNLTWGTTRTVWAETPQVNGGAIRAARGFVVGAKIFFGEYPRSDHETYWENEVGPNVPADKWTDKDENGRQILFFRLGPSPSFIFHLPSLADVEPETVLRAAQLMREMEVPPDVDVVWSAGLVADSAKAGEYYELIE